METIIWRFRTRQGSVRLNVGAPQDRLADLHGELRGCAIVADSLDEFIAMAARAAHAHGGMLGDVLTQPWAVRPLDARLRDAARVPDALEAAGAVLDAAVASSDEETSRFLDAADQEHLRRFVSDLVGALDERKEQYVADLAAAFRIDVGRLIEVLQPEDG